MAEWLIWGTLLFVWIAITGWAFLCEAYDGRV
jgi:hypothetical protein